MVNVLAAHATPRRHDAGDCDADGGHAADHAARAGRQPRTCALGAAMFGAPPISPGPRAAGGAELLLA
jgi:hypothetical protein